MRKKLHLQLPMKDESDIIPKIKLGIYMSSYKCNPIIYNSFIQYYGARQSDARHTIIGKKVMLAGVRHRLSDKAVKKKS